MTQRSLLFSHVTLLFCRYSPVEGSMKPAGPLSASAAARPSPISRCCPELTAAVNPVTPPPTPPLASSRQPAEK